MAIQTLNTIKNWFRTGLKPTQTQFWDTWDSFRHKDQKVSVTDIEDIDELLSSKTDKSDFKTINGESILGSGDIGIDGGGSQDLQSVLDNGEISNKNITLTNNSNFDSYLRLTPVQLFLWNFNSYISMTTFQFSINSPSRGLMLMDRSIRVNDIINNDSTNILNFDNIVQGNNITLNLPFNKPSGNYTLATLDDISLSTVMETSSMWYHYENGYPSKWFSVDDGFSAGGFSAGTNSAFIGVTPNAGFHFKYTDPTTSSTLNFLSTPFDSNDGANRNLQFSLPTNKATGAYTVATTEDFPKVYQLFTPGTDPNSADLSAAFPDAGIGDRVHWTNGMASFIFEKTLDNRWLRIQCQFHF
jgi:hypothetical protein